MTQYLNPEFYRLPGTEDVLIPRARIDEFLDKRAISVRMLMVKRDNSQTWWTIRRNGKTQTWKRDPNRIRIPFKMGLYGYGAITEQDFIER